MFELYRPEAVDYARMARLGDVSSAIPYRGWRVWALVVSAFSCLVALALVIQVPQQRIVRGLVRAAGATVRIYSEGHWIIGDVFVHNDERVQKGQPLFTASEVMGSLADTNVHTRMLKAITERQAELQQQLIAVETLHRARANGLAEKITARTDARKQLHAQISLQQSRSQIARQSLVDVRDLIRRGFVSRLEYQRRQDKAIATQQDEIDLQRQDDVLRAEIADDQLSLAQLDAETATALARLRGQIADTESSQARVSGASNFVVRAPAAGVIADWNLAANSRMQPSMSAGVLLTEPDHLVGEVLVPTSASGFLKQGQVILLDYDGFPAAQFGFGRGTVVSISSVPVANRDAPAGVQTAEGYRVILSLEKFAPRTNQAGWAFRPGLQFEAHFVSNRVPLWRALLAPLFEAER